MVGMLRLVRWLFFALAGTACLLGGTALAMIIAERRLEKPNANFAFAVDRLEHDGYGTLARLIGRARLEVFISARQITSNAVLEALKQASERKIDVRLLLDRASNPQAPNGSLQYLLHNHVGRVWFAPRPLYDQFVVIDGQFIFTTAAPWSAAAAKDLATVMLLKHRGAGGIMRRHFEDLTQGAQPAAANLTP